MERLGLMVGNATVLFNVETGEILCETRKDILEYLERKDGFYTLQVF